MTSTNEHGQGRDYPSQAVVDLAAIRHNLGVLRAAAPGALQLATVKANAYGHGLLPVALAALEGGADWLGVAQLAEAFTLREGLDEAGVARADAPLLAWISTSSSDFAAAIDADIDVSVSWTWVLADICAAARQVGRPARVHVKIDTGMSRAGSTLADLPALASALRMAADEGLVDVVGAWSHMSRADDPSEAGNASTASHVRIFEKGLAILTDAGITPRIRHLSATSGILWHPEAHYDMVRAGIGLYGLSPDPAVATAEELGLIPALEEDASRTERDLIVAASRRAQTKHDLATARQRRDELAARGQALSRLAATAVAAVAPAPRLAVPDVTALGDPAPEDIEAYLHRLDRVEAALETVQGAYGQALARRDELAGQIEAYAAKAATLSGGSSTPGSRTEAADDLGALRARATEVLAHTPVDLARLAGLAAAQQAYLTAYEKAETAGGPGPGGAR